MWLKRLVAVSMIITLIGMNAIAIIGILAPTKTSGDVALIQPATDVAPVVSLTLGAAEVNQNSFTTITWSTTGQVTSCQASGAWTGEKTAFGTQSTGRLSVTGELTYGLTCSNEFGDNSAQQILTVVETGAATPTTPTPTPQPTQPQVVYCSGASPCYGPADVVAHNSVGNCWGYNGNRVMNISTFDSSYHRTKSGISSIEISEVCGKDLAPSLDGRVSAGGQTRDHNNSSKANADRNMLGFFVGYYDSNKK